MASSPEIPMAVLLNAPKGQLSYEELHRRVAYVQVVLAAEKHYCPQYHYDPDELPLSSSGLNQDILKLKDEELLTYRNRFVGTYVALTQQGMEVAERTVGDNVALREAVSTVASRASEPDANWDKMLWILDDSAVSKEWQRQALVRA